MTNLFLYFIFVYGVATIIANEYIFANLFDKLSSFNKLQYLVTCNKCLSVWVGLCTSLLGFGIIHPIVDAVCAFTVTKLINTITNTLDSVVDYLDQ